MAFSPRARATIRDSLLADWAARYLAAGKALLTIPGSDAYMFADALAVELEALEAQASQLTLEILPDKASEEFVERHANVQGVARTAAIKAVLVARVTGTPSTFINFGTSVLTSTAGLRYAPNSTGSTTNGSGYVDVAFTCTTAGAAGNLPAGTTLTWSSTPGGAGATAVVQSASVTGADQESVSAWAARIIARLQERPASGNRSDVRDWIEATDAALEAYVYPLLHDTLGVNTPGSWSAVALGPAQGDSVTDTRVIGGTPGAVLAAIEGYVEGTYDKGGAATSSGTQLRAVTLPPDNYRVRAASVASQDVDATLVVAASQAFPWAGTMTVHGSSTSSSLVVTGDHTAKAGSQALVFVGTSLIRGGYQVITLPSGSFAAGNTTFAVAMLGTPSAAVYPAPPNWSQLRLAAFAYFDNLGPGDTSPASRWPAEETKGRATLYRAALQSALINGYGASYPVTGVLSASVGTPVADVTPAAKTLVTLGTFLVHA